MTLTCLPSSPSESPGFAKPLAPLGAVSSWYPAPAELPAGAALLPRRAQALNGAGQQTTARRHRGLLPAVSVRLELEAQASTHS